jgi:hypothetical protein
MLSLTVDRTATNLDRPEKQSESAVRTQPSAAVFEALSSAGRGGDEVGKSFEQFAFVEGSACRAPR